MSEIVEEHLVHLLPDGAIQHHRVSQSPATSAPRAVLHRTLRDPPQPSERLFIAEQVHRKDNSSGPAFTGPLCCRLLSSLEHRLGEPLLEADLAEPRAVGGHERAFAEQGAEVA